LLSLAGGVNFWGLALYFGKQRPAVPRAPAPGPSSGLLGTPCAPQELLPLGRPSRPPLLPFFPFYFCRRCRGGISRTTPSAMDAALCVGTFSLSLLIISCCLAGYCRTPRSRCWRSALSVSSVAFVNANV